MSAPDDLRDLYCMYVLGILEEPERSQIEEALKSGSPEAKEHLRRAMEYNAMLLGAATPVDPPKRLRNRVLGSVGVVERNWGWLGLWGAATAALIIGVVYYGNQYGKTRVDLQYALSESARTNTELVRARQILAFLNAAETKVVTFGQKDPKPPSGKVLLNPTRGVLLIANNLPPAPAGKIYEMWIIPKGAGARPIPAGLFQTDTGGNGLHMRQTPVALDSTIAVTLEPESGSDAPTTTPLFAAAL
jgi:anti-sigma-K factor RskA